jgi:hypothetical protein
LVYFGLTHAEIAACQIQLLPFGIINSLNAIAFGRNGYVGSHPEDRPVDDFSEVPLRPLQLDPSAILAMPLTSDFCPNEGFEQSLHVEQTPASVNCSGANVRIEPWYSPLAILTALTLRTVFRLALRQTER